MKPRRRLLSSILLGAVLFSPVMFNGCTGHASDQVYDPAYHDNHKWDSNENERYRRWEAETRRDHRDLQKRNSDEQKEYWTWRHNPPDERH
jgi:hypothetical protein